MGSASHRLKIGVATGGLGAGRSIIRSVGLVSEIRLGADDSDIVKINKGEGVSPAGDNKWPLGSTSSRWTAVYAVNGTIQTSDRREKQKIQELDYGLDEVMALRAVSFEWNNGKYEGRHLGLIAQETETVVPEVVVVPEQEDGHYGLRYSELIPVLIKAVQEQQELIATQSKLISSQGNRIAAIEAHLGRALGSK